VLRGCSIRAVAREQTVTPVDLNVLAGWKDCIALLGETQVRYVPISEIAPIPQAASHKARRDESGRRQKWVHPHLLRRFFAIGVVQCPRGSPGSLIGASVKSFGQSCRPMRVTKRPPAGGLSIAFLCFQPCVDGSGLARTRTFFTFCSIGRCSHVFGLSMRFT
jgi:hypothetical protein